MTTMIRSFRCKDERCDVPTKHYHVSYFSESNGVVVNIGSSEPASLEIFHSLKECREYCKNIPGIVWKDETK